VKKKLMGESCSLHCKDGKFIGNIRCKIRMPIIWQHGCKCKDNIKPFIKHWDMRMQIELT